MVTREEDIPRLFNVTNWFLDRNLEEGRGAATALVTDDDGHVRRTSYADLAALTNRIGHVLRDLGVRREDRVLLALSDGVEFVATWFAVLKIGAVAAEVYTYLHPGDYAYYLDYTGAEVVVVDPVTLDRVREAARGGRGPRHLLVVNARPEDLLAHEHDLTALVAAAPAELDPAPTSRDDVAIWKFTTGSTGAPKACVHPHRTPRLSFEWYARGVLGMTADDLVLPVPKLFFGYARDLAALFPFGVGGAGVVFPGRSTPERIFELLDRHRPTILVNVPTMMNAMVTHPSAAERDLRHLRVCTSAGEALPGELHRRWLATFGVEVLDGIGSSEAYHIYVSNRPGDARPGSLGRVVPGYRVEVTDGEGRPVPDGEVGVLEVTGGTVALGYWDAPEKTAATFHGATVRSGDLVVRDPDGFLWYRGRADDLLKVGGVWVAPREVEDCLLDHPDVLECAVTGYEEDGLVRPRAHVVPRPGVAPSPELAEALQRFTRTRLSPHKYPRDVRFVAALPRTASGKIDRRALRERPDGEDR
ncbi:benzoate-CoA ligase (EC 6.2.1.25) [Streptoalloteichus tenebrarius]|uniref:Benzoate-CoA ligase n=1 Tax=Streptoalloteichus tenebrarius (strain ATCC 17920 / DSM 40477 / JCM 4838 / CBS 697.72 / NBRC 16177 / NCIMB 11028 / NRRL B-12390 / A12253. 1 / ISP 5477) TaxID=1933 RepID=A0ABT1HYT5_STRSD|nr:benzoate-CoA ligase family protein [Streptoalloteichus tenebrarius]MCP2260692.1 benzoate-CoA ligase (EC 6.2.1.25) [Streptoalloteichus tenebrarius]BFF03775.1 benzoate-CoA ligase family protein [Streptoalloteichus tenebrarius]